MQYCKHDLKKFIYLNIFDIGYNAKWYRKAVKSTLIKKLKKKNYKQPFCHVDSHL